MRLKSGPDPAHLTVQTHRPCLEGYGHVYLHSPVIQSNWDCELGEVSCREPIWLEQHWAGEHTQPVQLGLDPILQSVWGLKWWGWEGVSAEVGGCVLGAGWHQLLGFLALAAILPGRHPSWPAQCTHIWMQLSEAAGVGPRLWLELCAVQTTQSSCLLWYPMWVRKAEEKERHVGGRMWDVPSTSLSSEDFLAFPNKSESPKEEADCTRATPSLNQADPQHTCFYF